MHNGTDKTGVWLAQVEGVMQAVSEEMERYTSQGLNARERENLARTLERNFSLVQNIQVNLSAREDTNQYQDRAENIMRQLSYLQTKLDSIQDRSHIFGLFSKLWTKIRNLFFGGHQGLLSSGKK